MKQTNTLGSCKTQIYEKDGIQYPVMITITNSRRCMVTYASITIGNIKTQPGNDCRYGDKVSAMKNAMAFLNASGYKKVQS